MNMVSVVKVYDLGDMFLGYVHKDVDKVSIYRYSCPLYDVFIEDISDAKKIYLEGDLLMEKVNLIFTPCKTFK